MAELRLNLGCGAKPLAGFRNIDRRPAPGVSVGEIYPLDLPDGCADEIRASHVLEHFSRAEVPLVLGEWARALKPGGLLKIAVPDFDKLAQRPHRWDDILMGGQTHLDDFHRSVFDREKLTRCLVQAGFDEIGDWTSEIGDCAALPVSLNLQGVKRRMATQEAIDIKIAACLSLPRLGWNDHWGCIVDGLSPFKIPVRRYTGAFWEQGIQRTLESCVKDGLDWALCLDYDTLFTVKDLDRLCSTLASNPHIDALAAMQPRRGNGHFLMTVGTKGDMKTSITIDGSPIKCRTAHFGFTLIRLDRLKDLPKPWFCSKPGPQGGWEEDDRVDADIWFWKQWEENGRTLYVDPLARVGHIECMASVFDEHYQQKHVPILEWQKGSQTK